MVYVVAFLLGLACITAGIYGLLGLPAGILTAGLLLVLVSVLGRMDASKE